MEVRPVPGLEQLPYAEVWLESVDDDVFASASAAARAIGKTGLEVWTTTKTPTVAPWFLARGYEEHRRYVISELDVANAADLGSPALPLVTLAARPDLAQRLFELALVAHADQPGREGTTFTYDQWTPWGLDGHPADGHFIALDGDDVIAYGYLEEHDGTWKHGFTAVARAWRGRGVAGAIKRAQIAWAREHGIDRLETATEVRLTGMRDLNTRCGYVPLYDEVVLRGPTSAC